MAALLQTTSSYLVCYGYFGFVSDLGWTYAHNLARAWADAELGTTSKYVQGLGLVMDDDARRKVYDPTLGYSRAASSKNLKCSSLD